MTSVNGTSLFCPIRLQLDDQINRDPNADRFNFNQKGWEEPLKLWLFTLDLLNYLQTAFVFATLVKR